MAACIVNSNRSTTSPGDSSLSSSASESGELGSGGDAGGSSTTYVHVLKNEPDSVQQDLMKAKVRKMNLELARAEEAAARQKEEDAMLDQNLITLHLETYMKFKERLKQFMSMPLEERDALAIRVTTMQIKREHEFFKKHGVEVSDEIDELTADSLNTTQV
jgi:cytidylate kinase